MHGVGERSTSLERASSPGSQRRITLIKTAIGAGLLVGLLVWNGNGWKLLEVFSHFHPEYAVALFVIAFALAGASSMKWSLFPRHRGHAITQARLFGLYLMGYFFNNFIHSSIGRDLARIYLLGRQMSSHLASAGSVLVVTPVILLLTMIPVSPNNIGWREWCFSILLVEAGASAAEGLAVGLTIRAVTLCVSLIGGLLFLHQDGGQVPLRGSS